MFSSLRALRALTSYKINPQTTPKLSIFLLPPKTSPPSILFQVAVRFFRGLLALGGFVCLFSDSAPSPRPTCCKPFEVQQHGSVLLYFRHNPCIHRPVQAFKGFSNETKLTYSQVSGSAVRLLNSGVLFLQ